MGSPCKKINIQKYSFTFSPSYPQYFVYTERLYSYIFYIKGKVPFISVIKENEWI